MTMFQYYKRSRHFVFSAFIAFVFVLLCQNTAFARASSNGDLPTKADLQAQLDSLNKQKDLSAQDKLVQQDLTDTLATLDKIDRIKEETVQLRQKVAEAPEKMRQVQSTRQRLEMAMDYYLANRTRRFTQIHHRLQQQHPQLRLARQQTMLERLQKRMSFALENQLKRTGQQQQRLTQRLNQQNPQPKIHRAQTRIQQLEYRLAETLRAQLSATRERFGNAVTHLEAVSPLSTLARGYSVTTATDGNVLKKVKQVKAGEMLTTRLEDGWIESEVKNIQPVKKSRKKVH